VVTLYLTGALLFSLGLDIYPYLHPQEVSFPISQKYYTINYVLVLHMLGNVICMFDEGMWDEDMPKSKKMTFIFVVLILLLVGLVCLWGDKLVDHNIFRTIALVLSVTIGWSLVALLNGSIKHYFCMSFFSIFF